MSRLKNKSIKNLITEMIKKKPYNQLIGQWKNDRL